MIMMKCSHCGSEQKDGSTFCSECGNKLEAPKKYYCSNCGKELQLNEKFCSQCGASTTNNSRDATTTQSELGDQGLSGKAGEFHASNPVPPYFGSSKVSSAFQKWKKTLLDKWNELD